MIWSLSVDLDGLGCYAAIHGQDPKALDERALRAVPQVAVERLCALFAEEGIPATLFAIGRELALPGAASALRAAAEAGHEIASHSFAHDYALSRRSSAQIAQDLADAEAAIERATGRRPRGFRAPGYTLSRVLLAELKARGYAYDSSLLPSPAYYAAKAAAIGFYALRGRPSQSILGGVGQLFARRGPHRRRGVRELPVSTLPVLRAPLIGTVLLGLPTPIASRLARLGAAGGHFNLELHGIDALDATDGAPPALAAAQPGLSLPAAEKLRRLRRLVRALKQRGEACTLEAAADRLLPRG